MNIKELEFIRDFYDSLSELHQDLLSLSISLDNFASDDELVELPRVGEACISAICHQAGLAKSLFLSFKNRMDKKYWDEWVNKYPHMSEQQHEEE